MGRWLWPKTVGYDQFPLAAYGWGTHTPHTRKQSHLSRLKSWAHQPNKLISVKWTASSFLHPTISVGRCDFATYPPYPSKPEVGTQGPWSHMLGRSLAMDKHGPLLASGNVDLKWSTRWDMAIGAHVYLTLHNQVWNPSHSHPTSLDLRNTPKDHHDTARG
jgi:hypothetical protein